MKHELTLSQLAMHTAWNVKMTTTTLEQAGQVIKAAINSYITPLVCDPESMKRPYDERSYTAGLDRAKRELGWHSSWNPKEENMIPRLTIQKASNGYMANFAPSPDDPLGHRGEKGPFVFESFRALTVWLDRQLNPVDSQLPMKALTASEINKMWADVERC